MEQQRLQDTLKQTSRIESGTGCWIWQGQVSNSGWGRMMINFDGQTRMVSACDASYLAFFSDIPDGKLVTLKCGNRLCVNPQHLTLNE